jgi:hypothetical protein
MHSIEPDFVLKYSIRSGATCHFGGGASSLVILILLSELLHGCQLTTGSLVAHVQGDIFLSASMGLSGKRC